MTSNLSKNLINKLNESVKNKLTEGAGAGYTVKATVDYNTIVINSFNVVSKSEPDKYGEVIAELDCDIDVGLTEVSAESYDYGGEIEGEPIPAKITHLSLNIGIEYNEETDEDGLVEINESNIKDALDDLTVDPMLSAGWSHITFDGDLSCDYKKIDMNIYSNITVQAINMVITNQSVIGAIDDLVRGEDNSQYIVRDVDSDILEQFDDEDEAIEWAKANDGSYVEIEYYNLRPYFDGESIDYNYDFYDSETVWTREDDLEESALTENINKRINEAKMTPKEFIIQCKELEQFDDKQLLEIRLGFYHGLSMEQVSVYAKPEFGSTQMAEIRYGFIDGLTMEQVQLYVSSDFDDEQMMQIREGFENGLTVEQVQSYANPEFSMYRMSEIREELEDKNIEEKKEESAKAYRVDIKKGPNGKYHNYYYDGDKEHWSSVAHNYDNEEDAKKYAKKHRPNCPVNMLKESSLTEGVNDDVNEMWDKLIDIGILEETLQVITAINGYTTETMEDILFATSGNRSFDQLKGESVLNESVLTEEVENEAIQYMWDNYDEYGDGAKEKINKIINNLNFVAKTHEVTSEEGISVAVEDTSTKMVFWLDFYKQGVDVVGEWNQYIFHKDNSDDMIREAIQSAYDIEYGDIMPYVDAESTAREYLEEKGFLTFNKETNEEELNTNIN